MTLFENLIWAHGNGDNYKIVGEAIIEETLEPAIVYQRVGAEPLIWVRPAKVFFERFSPVFPAKAAEPETVHVCLDAKDVSIKVGDTVVIAAEYRTAGLKEEVGGLKVVELKEGNLFIALDASDDSWVLRGKEVVVTAEKETRQVWHDHHQRRIAVGDIVDFTDAARRKDDTLSNVAQEVEAMTEAGVKLTNDMRYHLGDSLTIVSRSK